MNKKEMAKAFNEWMRLYTEEPARFEAEFRTVARFLKECADGREPTYGETCVAYLSQLMAKAA